MFKKSEIGPKCQCDGPETVGKELGYHRYLVPKGCYGGLYQSSGYYMAVWWELHCEKCNNRRYDFIVYKWHSNNDWTFVDGPMHPEGKPRKYPDIRQAILQMMPE